MSTTYIKRTQKDYTLNFKFQLVQEIETSTPKSLAQIKPEYPRGELSLSEAKLKYGIQGDSTILK